MRHNSSLVCMVGITYVHVDAIFALYGYILFYAHLCCFVGCLSLSGWIHAFLDVLYVCVL